MTNKAIIQNFYREVWNAHDASKVSDYVCENYIQHNPTVEQGRQGLLNFMKVFFAKEANHDIHLILEDGDLVAAYIYVTFKDGSKAVVTDIYRLENGIIVEHWDSVQKA